MTTPLTDLHCHILPGIDDGARDADIALQLLRKEAADGVTRIAFTPHFNYERTGIKKFVDARRRALRNIAEAAVKEQLAIKIKLGAEIYFTTALADMDFSELAITNTAYLLVELPTQYMPSGIDEIIFSIVDRGYTPILAHIERYPYVEQDPTLLYNWVNAGAIAQVNAASLIRHGKTAKRVQQYMEWGLVHLLSSDAHSPDKRPPNLREGFDTLSEDWQEILAQNARSVFTNRQLMLDAPHKPVQRLGRWR